MFAVLHLLPRYSVYRCPRPVSLLSYFLVFDFGLCVRKQITSIVYSKFLYIRNSSAKYFGTECRVEHHIFDNWICEKYICNKSNNIVGIISNLTKLSGSLSDHFISTFLHST